MPVKPYLHASFVIERVYDATPTRVFNAWLQPEAKARWFVGPDAWEKSDHTALRNG